MDQGQTFDFLHWITVRQTQLTEYCTLYFGDAAIICSDVGRNYLKSAYRFVIDTFKGGHCWRGMFSVRNFMVVNGLFMMDIPAPFTTIGDFQDLMTDVGALSNALLKYYRQGNIPALYTDHLHYITTMIPSGIGSSLVFQSRFICLIYYHFSFSLTDPWTLLLASLATAQSHLGDDDVLQFNNLLKQAWNELRMGQFRPVGKNWTVQAEKNPIFYEVMMWNSRQAGVPPRNGYRGNPQSLYNFGRNNKVHAPEKTKGPRGAQLGQMEPVAPNGAGHWRWTIISVAGQRGWGWVWQPAQGQWFWPTVPGDMQW
ncbi:uncharacterized protein LOC119287011 [Triticum dicoccoides]|uniref:uncharacterized protein LOC119287011 n=1 Tax=Triticum dicoccoides TaxID=85692 RepID=UPI00188EFB48|nr:uncharacterized protein LOC119287011 [Triticum dicoccoides]